MAKGLLVLVALSALLLTSCSRFWDADVTNHCSEDVAVAFWGNPEPPMDGRIPELPRHRIAGGKTILIEQAVAVPSGFFGGGLALLMVGNEIAASVPIAPADSEPVPVDIPLASCP